MDSYNEKIFHTYFTKSKDIGDIDIILHIADEIGLDAGELKSALSDGRYRGALRDSMEDGRQNNIDSTPTFIINGQHVIIGAQPIDTFRKTLMNIGS